MKFAPFLSIALVFAPLIASAQSAEDWDFTPQDYQALVARGEQLRFEADSQWLPPELKENLRVTLTQVLSGKEKLRSTDGVNLIDFFHGHIACERPETTDELGFNPSIFADETYKNAGLGDREEITQQNYSRFAAAHELVKNRVGQFLADALQRKLCQMVVIYHTYEYPQQSRAEWKTILANDPRRNLYTAVSDLKPTHFTPPPNPDSPRPTASTWTQRWQYLTDVGFLIDRRGVIHAVNGTTARELALITGL